MPRHRWTLYLASRSFRRQELLRDLKVPFKVVPSAYRERWCRKTAPEVLCVRHAIGKARKAVLSQTMRFVLGGDTIVWHHGRGLGKPRGRAEALRMLRGLAGKKHAVYTGLAIWDRKSGSMLTGCAKTNVWMKPAGEAWLQNYVDTIHPFDKAGAYAIQACPDTFQFQRRKNRGGSGYRGFKENKNQDLFQIVRKIRGSYSNVVGLPKELFRKMLKELEKRSDVPRRPKSLHFEGR